MSTISFAQLKQRNRSQSTEELKTKMAATSKTTGKDDRFWKPTMKKSDKKGSKIVGTSFDVIRFLPMCNQDLRLIAEGKYSDDLMSPIFHRKYHQFQGPNGWYIEESRAMLGDDCPVYERVRPLWNEAKERNDKGQMDQIKNYFQKDEFIANILVVNDGSNPDNNGKVFLFRVTKAMKKILDDCFDPQFEGETAFNPFDVDDGRNLDLKLEYEERTIGQNTVAVADYAKVVFQSSSCPVADGEDEIEAILDRGHSVLSYLDKVKSREDLEARLEKVFTYKSAKPTAADYGSQAPKSYESAPPQSGVSVNDGDDDLDDLQSLLNA